MTNNIEELPDEIMDMIQVAFERTKLKAWKHKVLVHLKNDPGALPEIQGIAQNNIEKSEGIVKEFNQWILNGCNHEIQI